MKIKTTPLKACRLTLMVISSEGEDGNPILMIYQNLFLKFAALFLDLKFEVVLPVLT